MDQEKIFKSVTRLKKIFIDGCSNHGCKFNPVTGGMKTNGICKCRHYMHEELETIKRELNI